MKTRKILMTCVLALVCAVSAIGLVGCNSDSKVKDLEDQIAQLKTEKTSLQSEVNSLENDKTALQSDKDKLQSDLDDANLIFDYMDKYAAIERSMTIEQVTEIMGAEPIIDSSSTTYTIEGIEYNVTVRTWRDSASDEFIYVWFGEGKVGFKEYKEMYSSISNDFASYGDNGNKIFDLLPGIDNDGIPNN